MKTKIKIGDCFAQRGEYLFIVSKVIDRLDTLYKFANIRFNAKTQELRYYYTFEGEYDVLGKRIDGKVFDAIEQMVDNMRESINITKERAFDRLISHLEEAV
jgi:hypothetical protein